MTHHRPTPTKGDTHAQPFYLAAGAILGAALAPTAVTAQGPVAISLCNFDARIIREEVRNVGAEKIIIISIEGTLQDGTPLPRTEVSAEHYASMRWITTSWGNRAIVNAGRATKDHLRTAIQLLSNKHQDLINENL